jgi:hypothetical protein
MVRARLALSEQHNRQPYMQPIGLLLTQLRDDIAEGQQGLVDVAAVQGCLLGRGQRKRARYPSFLRSSDSEALSEPAKSIRF